MAANRDIWIFGYGSLMWRPEFAHIEMQPALLRGYHRALCVRSIRYRGTPERPGLVVGLDRGGSCRGRALRVAGADREAVMAYLRERELTTDAYVPKWLPVAIPEGRILAYTFVVNRRNDQHYMGKLAAGRIVDLIVQGEGARGSALEYLENVIAHLDDMGMREGALHQILRRARARAERARRG